MLHLLPTGHNPVRDAVSDYGVGPPFDVATLWDGYGPATLDRWIIDPAAGKVTQQTLNDRAQEFPRVDDRVISRPYQYGYGAMIGEVSQMISPLTGNYADEVFTKALLKHDRAHGTAETHDFSQHTIAGEAVFAPAAPGAAEDDGHVCTNVHNPDRGASDLVILAAQGFIAETVAGVHLPARTPPGFRGSWLADQDHGRDRQRQTGPAPGTTTAGDSPPAAAGSHPRSPVHTMKEESDGNHHH